MYTKLTYIDALRGLAILMVITVHTSQIGLLNIPDFFKHLVYYGAYGVQLFFIASAFTLFLSFENRKKKEKHEILNFFLRRFFRIAPMYYLGIIYYTWIDPFLLSSYFNPIQDITLFSIFSHFTFTHGISPYWLLNVVPGGWSVGVEVMFYCLIPILFPYLNTLDKAIKFLCVILLIDLLLFPILYECNPIADKNLWDSYLNYFFLKQIPVFVLGVIAYLIIIKGDKIKEKGLWILLAFTLFFEIVFGKSSNEILFVGVSFVFLMLGISKFPTKIILNKFVCYWGKISYSAYLVHFAILHWLPGSGIKISTSQSGVIGLIYFGFRCFIVLISTAIISTIFYLFVETPMRKFGSWLISFLEKEQVEISK